MPTQVEYWNGPAARRSIAVRERLDRSIASITSALIELAAPRPGEHVLDIGCGYGTTSIELAERVAPGGTVTGIDISAPMLEVARQRARSLPVELIEADAATHRFGACFDLAFSRYGVMFFTDPVAAFTGIRADLAPGGRLVFVCWRAVADNPWVMVPMAAVRDLLPPPEPTDPEAPGPFAFASRDRLHRILTAAGFAEVAIDAHDDVMVGGDTPEDTADHILSVGPLARAADELSPEIRREMHSRIATAVAGHVSPRGIAIGAATWLVRCRG